MTEITCTRCAGSGKHSFNLKDGDVCYKCSGKGTVLPKPKGRRVKPTAKNRYVAVVGDIFEDAEIIYRVEKIVWTALRPTAGFPVNQKMTLTRLSDGKLMTLTRGVVGADRTAIVPTPEMIGKDA